MNHWAISVDGTDCWREFSQAVVFQISILGQYLQDLGEKKDCLSLLLFLYFVTMIFVSIERTICLGLSLMKTLKFRCSYARSGLDSHAWTQMSFTILVITASEMSAWAWQMWQGPTGVLLAQQLEVQQDYLGMSDVHSCLCLSSWIKTECPSSQGRPKQHQKHL